jgi:hypothetical protein
VIAAHQTVPSAFRFPQPPINHRRLTTPRLSANSVFSVCLLEVDRLPMLWRGNAQARDSHQFALLRADYLTLESSEPRRLTPSMVPNEARNSHPRSQP